MSARAATTDSERPPYVVPSMAEVLALSGTNGFRVASFFAGGGGSSTGYRMAGFDVVWASEFVEEARATYSANYPKTIVDPRDIRLVTASEVLDAIGLEPGELDVLDGSPPCASFSTAGNREDGWGKEKAYSDTKQRSDDLFHEYVRLVAGILPKVFVAENVSGLVKGMARGHFLEFLKAFKEAGYRVSARVLNAMWLGVPQDRARVIFVGVRNDLGKEPAHPKPLPYRYSVRDALPVEAPSPEELSGTDFVGYAIEREWQRLAPGEKSHRYLNLSRLHPDRSSPTVTATGGSSPGTASVTCGDFPRKFTIRELKAICSFPDDYVLTGSYAQQWERLGRAVPPLMMRAVAATVRDMILA